MLATFDRQLSIVRIPLQSEGVPTLHRLSIWLTSRCEHVPLGRAMVLITSLTSAPTTWKFVNLTLSMLCE